MKNIYLNAGTINKVFNELETSFKGVLNSNNNEFKLALDSNLIKGNIDGVTFINGITSIQASITFSDETLLSIEPLSKSSILFAYCTEGSVKHSFGISGHKSILRKHHSAVVTSTRSINTILHFQKNIPVKLSLIKVETEEAAHANSSLISQLKKTFLHREPNYSYQGLQNLKIAEKFEQLDDVTSHGMIGHTIKKEILQSILALEIEDNTDNLIKMSRAIKRSTLNQINELKKIPNFIKNYAVETLYSKVINSKNRIIFK
ncbi:hypothetical protein [Flavobacterium xinjiangense]|uniref:Uncharacterized protein n=1 Tax=Flavobacterium xinjiangense TaxID=178356 RepID=A0A1M7JZK4_9FLAO|nr:hypothetical protein [Flavobacterium xinjiangense]SHM58490.1 hypothetical protein SAMN05216269_105135 [Flavobacterium xinjiangense]